MSKKNIKKIMIITITVISLVILPITVSAKEININNEITQITTITKSMAEEECKSILGDVQDDTSTAWLVNKILNYIKVLGPTLAILLSSLDFAKAIVTSDDDSMKKAQSKFVKRMIAAVCLFFVPLLTQVILELFGITTNDATCGLLNKKEEL